jgi:hypothetical protein
MSTSVYGGDLGTNVAHGMAMRALWAGVSVSLRESAVSRRSQPGGKSRCWGCDWPGRSKQRDPLTNEEILLSKKIGKVPFKFAGGTEEQRQNLLGSFRQVLLHTPEGQRMLNELETGNDHTYQEGIFKYPHSVIVVIVEGDVTLEEYSTGAQGHHLTFNFGSLELPIDTGICDGMKCTTTGAHLPSLTRIIAHELGHIVWGFEDDGPGRMTNVRRAENKIMRQLNEGYDRTTDP